MNYIINYLQYWYWFVLTVGLTLTVAYLYLDQYTPVYKVYTNLLIEKEKSAKAGEFSIDVSKQIENKIAFLKSPLLAGKIVDALGYTVSYWIEENSEDIEIYTDSPVKVNPTEITEYGYNNSLYIDVSKPNKYQLLDSKQISLGYFFYGNSVRSKHGTFKIIKRESLPISNTSKIKVKFHKRDALINELIGSLEITPINQKGSFLSLAVENTITKKGKDILSKLLEEFTSSTNKNKKATSSFRFIKERQGNTKKNSYAIRLDKKETAFLHTATVTDSRVVNGPYSTGGPIRPDRQSIFVAAFILGFLIPFSTISLKDMRIVTMRSKAEMDRKTNLKIGMKPEQKKGEVIDI